MIEPNYMDDMDMDFCGDFFDQIDDLLDFPSEDVEGGDVVGGDCNNAFQGIWPAPSDSLAGSGSIFSGNSTNNTSELPTELPVPHEDIAQLEWLSNFVEDSFSAGSITLDEDSNIKNTTTTTNHNSDSHQFRTSSPVSVLESSSSCSGGKVMPLSPKTHIPGRARTKRPRPATFNTWPAIPLISPTSSVTEPSPPISTSEFENFAESHPLKKIPKPDMSEQKKMKKKKKKLPPLQSDTDHFDLQQQQQQQTVAVRKCLHCEITKTPQWRAGPLGPKTLCNACGVRYKSGRLFPEYRPAASPTFVPSLHSNSHKKVQEMRTKGAQNMAADVPEFMPRSSHLPDYI